MQKKVDILAFGAHPDDVECAAAGVIIKHINKDKIVAIIDLTAGEMGSYGNPEIRKKESIAAAKILGVTYREQLELNDGAIENNEAARLLVIQAIRKYRPEIVLCNAIHDRHPDHSIAAKLVADASFLSGLKKKITFYEGIAQHSWRPKALYHYIQDYYIDPDFVIEITEQMDKKMEAIQTFKSQFVEPHDNSANSILGLLEQIKNMNSIYGRPVNARFAEGFTKSRYIGITDLFQLV